MEQSYSPSGEREDGGWSKRFWRSMSLSKESKRSQSVDGQDEAEMFQERTTYTTHAVDGDDGANGDNTHAKAGWSGKGTNLKLPRLHARARHRFFSRAG